MTRRMLFGGLAMLSCLATLWLLGARVLDRDREAAEQELADDQLRNLTEAARALGGELDQIGDDLVLSAALGADGPVRLDAILAVKPTYLALVIQRGDAAPVQVNASRAPAGVLALAGPVLDRMIETARREPGDLHISPGLSSGDDLAAWYRVFARRARAGDTVVAAVVDMRLLVAPPDLLRTGPSRLLVLSAHNVPAPASDPAMAAIANDPAADPALRGVVAAARDKQAGTTRIGAAAAVTLGLPDATAVVAAVPIAIDAGAPWVLALATSTASLEVRHAALVRRIALGGTLGLLLVAVATFYVVANARRAAALHERLRAAAAIQRAEDQVIRSAKLATAGQLAAGIAHEIGTPLNVARGRAEMTLLRAQGDATDTANIKIVVEQIDHVTRQIQQLLDYLRPQARQIAALRAGATLRSVAELLAQQAAAREVSLAVDAGDDPVLHADPGQLQQILVNLAINALDACAPGGHVWLRARSAGPAAVLEVADDGGGIPVADRAHVFDPFFTTKKRGQGTGLGLWVVDQIVRGHGAEIAVDDTPGGGTTFRITWTEPPR